MCSGVFIADHICDGDMCFNGGECAYSDSDSRSYTCTCAAGYQGANCQSTCEIANKHTTFVITI